MQFETVLLEISGKVATIRLNRPDALNGFNTPLRHDLLAALQHIDVDTDIRAVVLTGAGRGFSAGADLKEGMPGDGQTVQQQLQNDYRPIFRQMRDMSVPIIAALNGPVAGIAMGMAMYCDLAVMADNSFLLPPFTTIALVADGGINWQLARHMGYKRALEFCLECKKIDAQLALDLGLVNKVVPADELVTATQEWAERLSHLPRGSVAAHKKVMRHAVQNTWESSFDIEADLQHDLLESEDNIEGVTAFLEKRKPKFS